MNPKADDIMVILVVGCAAGIALRWGWLWWKQGKQTPCQVGKCGCSAGKVRKMVKKT